jgi:signal transduction histidine kinase/ActR/RegA family two-component response regulator
MLKGVYHKIIESGSSKALSESIATKIRYLNYCLIAGILMFIPNVMYEAYLGLPITTIIDCIFIFLIFIAYLINSKGKYTIARNFAILAANFVLVGGNYAEGMAAGNYLIYIPLFFIFSVLGKLKDELWQIIFLVASTTICLVVSLFFFPEYSSIQQISTDIVKTMFKANFVISLVLTIIFSYLIYRITQQKESELTIAKEIAEENAKIKLQFLSNMSHELRTPLNGIIGTTNLLKSETHNEIQNEHFELLTYSSTQMLSLVNDVLNFSKIDSGKIELEESRFNLETFIKNIYNSFAQQFEAKHLYFKLATDDDINFNILSDDIRLGQILNNLLSNALKFTHAGGVTFGVKVIENTASKLAVYFSVTDTGIGIPTEKKDKIFESFIQADLNTTRKYGGTGLGLSISKRLAEVFKTTLNVESIVNVGTTFYFDALFIKDNNVVEEVNNKTIDDLKDLKDFKILIAEDNKINMLIARKFLKKWGVVLTEAVNGKEAITFCENNLYDLILLDLEMPEADGYTALKEIRKIHPNIPAIAFTASAFENIEQVLLDKGFTDYVLKPFFPQDLNNKLYKQQQLLSKLPA